MDSGEEGGMTLYLDRLEAGRQISPEYQRRMKEWTR